MWTYQISTGVMASPKGERFIGYSGAGHSAVTGRNNPMMQRVVGAGPIPAGAYTIGAPHADAQTGPYTMDLDPKPGTETYGRSLFRCHGNNSTNDASHGCIILPPDARQAIWESGDHDLTVIA